MKNRFKRLVRANLNTVLDRIKQFEEEGGFDAFFEELGPPGSSGGRPTGSAPAPRMGEKTIREYYANLEVEYGADLAEVKEAYRRLMRRYHPDKFAHDSEMEALATDLSQELTRAYQAVESYIKTGRY